jgi:7-keto-8-aminopelargonate synthetase-like enzyme
LHEEINIFQSETMSKALGSYGGFISGDKSLTRQIRENSATYQSSTSLPPPVVAAGIAAIEIITGNPGLGAEVVKKSADLRNMVTELGFMTLQSNTPIIPLIFTEQKTAMDLSAFLEEKGIIVPYMNYPSENKVFILRIAVSVLHTSEQLTELASFLEKWKFTQLGST